MYSCPSRSRDSRPQSSSVSSCYSGAFPVAAKVPEIIVLFWVSKVLITAMGEAASDYLNAALGPAIAVPIMLVGLCVALKLQFSQERYVAWSYWLVVVTVAIASMGNRAAAAVCALVSALSFDFFLTVPYQSLRISASAS